MNQPVSSQPSVQRQSRWFLGLSTVAIVMTLLGVVGQIAVAAGPLWKGGRLDEALVNTGRQIVLCVPAVLYVTALYYARRVFLRIAAGEILVRSNGQGLLAMGRCLLIGGLWAMIAEGLVPYSANQPLALTMSETARSSSDVILAALGLALALIGRLMTTAAAVKAENDGFV